MTLQLVKDLSPQERASKACLFCNRKDDNELLYGKFYTNESVAAHYYCLLFSSGLEQKGQDEEGIMGFLKQDILRESKRGIRLSCSKCKHTGATVGCCNRACKRTYHFPCGVESRMLNQYFGAFNSFCIKHQPIQNVVVKCNGAKATCTICHEEVAAQPNFDVLWAPCCKKQSWFHRVCMQKLALSAGYFFKCPICSNNTQFCSEMKRCGIYVPEQDASWELEPNAFQELVQRHNKCDHPVCICPKGRQHDGEGTRWELLLCASCGSKGVHIGCGRLDWSTMEWDCEDCSQLESKRNKRTPGPSTTPIPIDAARSGIKRPRLEDNSSSESSDESDVDITSCTEADKFPSNIVTKPPPSRNVARRGRGSWSRAPSTRKSPCNFDNLRFKITDDYKNIIVTVDDKTTSKSYKIPVDQPTPSPQHHRIHANNN